MTLELPIIPSVNTDPVSLEARRVLVVDDLAVNREILFEQLTSWGLQVATVSGGERALMELAKANDEGRPFELVVTDFQMPYMDGAELVRRILSDPRLSNTRIIVASSVERKATADAFVDLEPSALLIKPVRSSVLYSEIERAFAPAQRPETPPPEVPAPTGDGDDASTDSAEVFRVLVAEDNVVNRRILENMVDRARCSMDFAEDGRQAYEAARREHYDVILMDISMPEMDGIEATKAIRAHEASSSAATTPIIALTAHAMEGDRQRFLAAGMNDYLTKPVRKADLRATMAKWLSDAAASRSPGPPKSSST